VAKPDITNKTDARESEGPFDPDLTFESFAIGTGNQRACQAAQMIADTPLKFCNPLLIYGGVGQGKTHLMHAIGNRMISHNPQAAVLYKTSDKFIYEYIQALQTNGLEAFRKKYREVDALLLEDFQFFYNKERTQTEFVHTLYDLLARHVPVVITLDHAASETDQVEPHLMSLLHQGLRVEISTPDTDLIKSILHKKAESHGMDIAASQINDITSGHQGESDIRKIIGSLSRMAFESWLVK